MLNLSNLYEGNELFLKERSIQNATTTLTIDESMMRDQRATVANQDNKHRLEDLCNDLNLKLNTSGNGVGEASERSRSKFKFTYKYGSVSRDREPSRLQCKKILKMFHKKSCRKCIECYISHSIPQSSVMKNFLPNDFRIYIATRLCSFRTVGKNTCSRSAYCCGTHLIYIATTRTKKHKNRDAVLCGNDDCGLNKCYAIKCNKQQEKFCVPRAKIFTSGDIELNPGPVDACVLLQSRLAQQELSILDVGGTGDCFIEQYLINCMVNLVII